nr:putative serine/threonine protein kinase ire [Quercus suber]
MFMENPVKEDNDYPFPESMWQALFAALIDFGLSKVGLMSSTDDLSGPPVSSTGATADWWSVGVILYEMLVGIPPFNAEHPVQIFDNIIKPKIPEEMSYEAHDLISKLGATGSKEVKQHPFFKDINWDTLVRQKAMFIPAAEGHDTSYFMSWYIWNIEDDHVSGGSDFDDLTETCSSGSYSNDHDEDVRGGDGEKMAEELETLWQKLKVTDEEEVSISLGGECTRAANERGRNCLFMKVLSRKGIMLEALRKNIRMLWKPNKSLQLSVIEEELFLVEFDDERDKRRVMDIRPWHYEKQLVLLQEFEGE